MKYVLSLGSIESCYCTIRVVVPQYRELLLYNTCCRWAVNTDETNHPSHL